MSREFDLPGGPRKVLQAVTIQYVNNNKDRVMASPEIVYHAARSAFERADDGGINTLATYLWATRPRYATERPARMAAALFRAAVDHSREATHLRQIVICEPASNKTRHDLARDSLLRSRDLYNAHPHRWSGCFHG
jgi:hypothetical protein